MLHGHCGRTRRYNDRVYLMGQLATKEYATVNWRLRVRCIGGTRWRGGGGVGDRCVLKEWGVRTCTVEYMHAYSEWQVIYGASLHFFLVH